MNFKKLEQKINKGGKVYFKSKGEKVYTIDFSKNNAWWTDDNILVMWGNKLYCFNAYDVLFAYPKKKKVDKNGKCKHKN